MSQKHSKHVGVLSRLVKTQIWIIVLLVFVILTVYISAFVLVAKKEARESGETSLTVFAENTDDHVCTFSREFIINVLLRNRDVTSAFYKTKEEVTANRIATLCDTLHAYQLTNSLFHSIYIYYLDSDIIVSTNGMYMANGGAGRDVEWLLWKSFSEREQWTIMNGYKLHYSLSDSSAQDVLSCTVRYPLNSRNDTVLGYISINLSTEQVLKSVFPPGSGDEGVYILTDSNGNYICSDKTIGAALGNVGVLDGNASSVINGKRYSVYYREMGASLRCFYLVPYYAYLEGIRSSIVIAVAVAFAAMMAPIAASLRLTRRIYKPIRELEMRSQTLASQLLGAKQDSQNASISSAMDMLSEKVVDLQGQIDKTQPDLENMFLHIVFSRQEPYDIETQMRNMHISMPNKYFTSCIAAFRNDTDSDWQKLQTIFAAIAEYLEGIRSGTCVILSSVSVVNGVALLINHNEEDLPEKIINDIQALTEAISNETTVTSISLPTGDVYKIHNHFINTLKMFEYLYLYPRLERFYEKDNSEWSKMIFHVGREQYEKLNEAVRAGDEKEMLRVLDGIRQRLESRPWAIESVKAKVATLNNQLNLMITEAQPGTEAESPLFMDVEPLQAADVDSAFTMLKDKVLRYIMMRRMYTRDDGENEKNTSGEYTPIMHYIDECIEKLDIAALSLNSVAQHFNKSPNYLSTMFMKTAGLNFKEYVTNKKLEKAAEKLRRSDSVVKTVANELGYYNVSNFIKIFRGKYGYTPGQYKAYFLLQQLPDENGAENEE